MSPVDEALVKTIVYAGIRNTHKKGSNEYSVVCMNLKRVDRRCRQSTHIHKHTLAAGYFCFSRFFPNGFKKFAHYVYTDAFIK